jgi:hypothetical protein
VAGRTAFRDRRDHLPAPTPTYSWCLWRWLAGWRQRLAVGLQGIDDISVSPDDLCSRNIPFVNQVLINLIAGLFHSDSASLIAHSSRCLSLQVLGYWLLSAQSFHTSEREESC